MNFDLRTCSQPHYPVRHQCAHLNVHHLRHQDRCEWFEISEYWWFNAEIVWFVRYTFSNWQAMRKIFADFQLTYIVSCQLCKLRNVMFAMSAITGSYLRLLKRILILTTSKIVKTHLDVRALSKYVYHAHTLGYTFFKHSSKNLVFECQCLESRAKMS